MKIKEFMIERGIVQKMNFQTLWRDMMMMPIIAIWPTILLTILICIALTFILAQLLRRYKLKADLQNIFIFARLFEDNSYKEAKEEIIIN